MRLRSLAGFALFTATLAACGGGATVTAGASVAPATVTPATVAPATATPATATPATATPAAIPTATRAPATPAPTVAPTAATASAWTVGTTSKATASVREQLVGRPLPNDAVLSTAGGTGAFVINGDGTFSADSKITFDLTTLASDSRDRDNFVKNDTLATRQFPTAVFVPTRATGVTFPLPASGAFTFTLAGKLTIRGKEKDVTFDVQARRDGANLTATATANPTFKFADFGMTAPSVPFRVVSVVDEIKLVIELVATART